MKINKLSKLFLGLFLSATSIFGLAGCASKPSVSPNVLCLQFNDYLEDAKENGTHDQMIDYWLSIDSENKGVDYKSLVNVNGTIKVGILDGTEPFCYSIKANEYTGLSVDLMYRFAKKYEYALKFEAYSSMTSLIAALTSGIVDCGAASTTITDERKQAVLFSEPFMNDETGLMVRKEDAAVIKDVSDVNNMKVAIKSGSMYPHHLQEVTTGNTYMEFNTVADICTALESRTVDCAVSDYSTFQVGVLHHPLLTTHPVRLFDNFLGVMFRKTTYSTFDELAGKNVGILDESIMFDKAEERLPNSNISVYTYDEAYDMVDDIKSGKIDAAAGYIDLVRYKDTLMKGFGLISDSFFSIHDNIVCPDTVEGKTLVLRFNEFIKRNNPSYLYNRLRRKWINHFYDGVQIVPDYKTLPNKNGHIKAVIDACFEPYAMLEKNRYVGVIIDYMTLFAEEYGFSIEFVSMPNEDHSRIFQNDKVNMYIDMGYMMESTYGYIRSDDFGDSKVNLIVRDSYSAKLNIFEQFAANFKKTFIIEDRYQIFLEGVSTTFIITIASIFFGLLLGFLVFVLIRNTPKVSSVIYKIINFLISGTPAVVFLMICFYIVFNGSNLSGTVVSIIAFSLIFMCSTVSFLNTGFNSVDKGQAEAAFTLGYSKPRTFFKVLFPQAAKTFMPILKGDIISHIKSTAIVGYIAVIDLTKASELVRSRTFDAFFSLICATVLYFALEYLIVFLLKLIPIDPKKRKQIPVLKGVEEAHD